MKNILLFSLLLLAVSFSKAQPATGNYKEFIFWNENTKLTWNDFKSTPLQNAAEAAMTASSMEFSYNTKNTQIFWNVTVKFFPLLSWTKKDKQSPYILKHEQLHFDITELYARLLRKQLAENITTSKEIQKLRSINKNILLQWQNEQNKYDSETNHSINEKKQIEWNAAIQFRLDELKKFASTK